MGFEKYLIVKQNSAGVINVCTKKKESMDTYIYLYNLNYY